MITEILFPDSSLIFLVGIVAGALGQTFWNNGFYFATIVIITLFGILHISLRFGMKKK